MQKIIRCTSKLISFARSTKVFGFTEHLFHSWIIASNVHGHAHVSDGHDDRSCSMYVCRALLRILLWFCLAWVGLTWVASIRVDVTYLGVPWPGSAWPGLAWGGELAAGKSIKKVWAFVTGTLCRKWGFLRKNGKSLATMSTRTRNGG